MALKNVHLTVIDPENDFCSSGQNVYKRPRGSLYVDGGQEDMERLAAFTEDVGDRIRAIHVTLDKHQPFDISHGVWFADDNGDEPLPFAAVDRYDADRDVFDFVQLDGTKLPNFVVRKPGSIPGTLAQALFNKPEVSYQRYTAWYIKDLAKRGRYQHRVWPQHCLIGTPGSAVYPALFEALHAWAMSHAATIDFVSKGSNPFTEHFGAVEAEVPLPDDPATQINTRFVQVVESADLHLFAGEALSHCTAATMRGLFAHFADKGALKRTVLLRDACSSVPGCEALGEAFLKEMIAQGMQTMTCAEARRLLK